MSDGIDLGFGFGLDFDPSPTPAEREAINTAIAATNSAGPTGTRHASAWREAGLQESVDRVPQEASPRSTRGALRA